MAKNIHSVLVIGGTGFVGSALVSELSRHPVERISIVHASPLRSVKPSPALYYRMSLAEGAVKNLVLAHESIVVLAQPDPAAMQKLAVMLCEARPRHVVYASTALLYDVSNAAATEESPLAPHSEYERAKLEEETILRQALGASFPLTIARLGNVYGDILNKGIIGKTLHALYRGESVDIAGNAVRDYIFIDDVASALATIALSPARGTRVVNISTGKGTPLEVVLAHIEKATGQKISRANGSERGAAENPWSVADNAAAKAFLSDPRSLRAGIKEANERFRAWYDSSNV